METQGTYNIDSVPVSGLTDRYQIGRTALYDRLKALGIEPEKRGRSSHISGSQLDQMDELDTRLKAGEPMPSNMTTGQTEHDRRTFTEHSPNLSTEHSPNNLTTLSPSTDSALLTLASMLQATQHKDPMANYHALQSACDHGWLLTTESVRELIGVKPHGAEFDRLGFRFVRSDRRTEWHVLRMNYPSPPPILSPEPQSASHF